MRLALLLSLVFLTSCAPAAIRREINFVDIVVQVGVVEVRDFEQSQPDVQLQLGAKAVKALRRLQPHTDNLKRWIERKGPADDSHE